MSRWSLLAAAALLTLPAAAGPTPAAGVDLREATPELKDAREAKWQAAMMARLQRRIKEREQLTDKGVEQFIDWHERLLLKTLNEMRGDLHLEDQQISDVGLVLVYRIRLASRILGDSSLTAEKRKTRLEALENAWRTFFARAVAADQKENQDFAAGLLRGATARRSQDRDFDFPSDVHPWGGIPVGPGDLSGISPER